MTQINAIYYSVYDYEFVAAEQSMPTGPLAGVHVVLNNPPVTFGFCARQLTMTCAEDWTAVTFSIVGKDENGYPRVYNITGSTEHVTITGVYWTEVESITVLSGSAPDNGTVAFGFGGDGSGGQPAGYTCWVRMDTNRKFFQLSAQGGSSSDMTYGFEKTLFAPMYAAIPPSDPVPPLFVFPLDPLVPSYTDDSFVSTSAGPIYAVRAKIILDPDETQAWFIFCQQGMGV